MRTVVIASSNTGKVREIMRLLHGLPLAPISMAERLDPVPVIPETGATFEENARIKAAWVFERTGEWTLADDSGLEVDALGGAPGVYSARYAGPGADDKANVRKLLDAMAGVPAERRTARFRCVVVLVTGVNSAVVASGTCTGTILAEPRGAGGFGYDPVFVPDGYTRTFAELDDDIKNAISHRGNALLALRRQLVRLDECL